MSDSISERGAALVSALLVVFLVGMMASAVLIRSQTIARDTTRDRGTLQSHYAAAAGLAKARVTLAVDPSWTGATFHLGNCEVVVDVRRTSPVACEVTARATAYPAGRRGLPVVTQLQERLTK